jgi:hypothetical protein
MSHHARNQASVAAAMITAGAVPKTKSRISRTADTSESISSARSDSAHLLAACARGSYGWVSDRVDGRASGIHSVPLGRRAAVERKVSRHAYPTAAAFVPDAGDLAALARAARACQGCDLYQSASQTVFGEGAADAAVVLIGEQPGDIEDRQGKPFAGPAGRLLDSALSDAGIPAAARMSRTP